MAEIVQADAANLLLRAIAPEDYALLRPHLRRVGYCDSSHISRAGEPIDTVCFPEGAVTAFLDVLDDGRRLAVGIVGREGVIGCPLLMGTNIWPYDVVVRGGDSSALTIQGSQLADACDRSTALRDVLLRFAGIFSIQMGRTIVSNLIQPVEHRLARWILLYHDRLEGDLVPITHKEIGIMLGVRRASATDALHMLEGRGAIRSVRGSVEIRDRAMLEELAGHSYGFAEDEYRRLIGAFGKGARAGAGA